jgi:hypothetical protein
MKKGLLILVTLALLSTFAFADMAASVYMTGSLYGTDGFVINNQDQKDSDMLQFSIGGETTGASFRLYAKAGEGAVSSRSAMLWWKPISMLKLSIGNVGGYGYTEQLNWWKTPVGASISQASAWENRWANNTTGEAGGIQVDLDPMAGLTLTAGVYPGFGNATGAVSDTDEEFYDANTAYGVQAKYSITGFGSVLAAYKDAGADKFKVGRIGCDINAVPNLYAFVTGIFYWDDHSVNGQSLDLNGMKVRGIAVDNYIKYSMDKITIAARFPFVIRLNEDDIAGDDSYMLWRVKVSYAMDGGITPYLSAETVDYVPLNFNDVENTLTFTIQPGLNWSIDKGSMDLSLKVDVYPEGVGPAGNDIVWSLPWEARVSF